MDFCYRLEDAGYRNVYTPQAELIHKEGASRGFGDKPSELAALRARYGGRGDRYLNPNLTAAFKVRPIHLARDPLRKLRVAVVTHNLNLEGAPKALLETCRCLTETSLIEPLIFSPLEGPLRAEYRSCRYACGRRSHAVVGRAGTREL